MRFFFAPKKFQKDAEKAFREGMCHVWHLGWAACVDGAAPRAFRGAQVGAFVSNEETGGRAYRGSFAGRGRTSFSRTLDSSRSVSNVRAESVRIGP